MASKVYVRHKILIEKKNPGRARSSSRGSSSSSSSSRQQQQGQQQGQQQQRETAATASGTKSAKQYDVRLPNAYCIVRSFVCSVQSGSQFIRLCSIESPMNKTPLAILGSKLVNLGHDLSLMNDWMARERERERERKACFVHRA